MQLNPNGKYTCSYRQFLTQESKKPCKNYIYDNNYNKYIIIIIIIRRGQNVTMQMPFYQIHQDV